jgi:hypothetical protein
MGYGLLKGKRGIIFGALDENSIATYVAKKAIEEGAEIVLTNAPVAFRAGTIRASMLRQSLLTLPVWRILKTFSNNQLNYWVEKLISYFIQ